jgi:hypothetical protein
MHGRSPHGTSALSLLGLAIVVLISPGVRASARVAGPPAFPLSARLTVSPDLPALSRRVMIAEAEGIWRREGVALTWPAIRATEATSAPLRVLVIARREAADTGNDQLWPVGELVAQTEHRALAIASIAGAERVLFEARRHRLLESPAVAQYRLGVVLGRAMAHEIGHYLLNTPTHAQDGLMRAAIDAPEFADPAAQTFGLDRRASQWLRARIAGDPSTAALPGPGFAYSR